MLEDIPHDIKGDVFLIIQDALEYHFRKAIKDAELVDQRFHDLRHDATSRMVEGGGSEGVRQSTTLNPIARQIISHTKMRHYSVCNDLL